MFAWLNVIYIINYYVVTWNSCPMWDRCLDSGSLFMQWFGCFIGESLWVLLIALLLEKIIHSLFATLNSLGSNLTNKFRTNQIFWVHYMIAAKFLGVKCWLKWYMSSGMGYYIINYSIPEHLAANTGISDIFWVWFRSQHQSEYNNKTSHIFFLVFQYT